MYARILTDGKPENVYLGLMNVNGASAADIAQELGEFLTGLGIVDWKARIVGLGTDGASVNMGCHGGLGVLLKKDIPYLVQIHCVAHKLELGVLDACKGVAYLSKFQNTIKSLLKFYSHSGKRLRELSAVSEILDITLRKYGKWNSTRWIASKVRVMKAVNDNWTSTITHLEEKAASSNSSEANTAKGLLRTCRSVRFIAFLGFMCDFTTALSKLSEAFQSDDLSLSSVLDELDATLGYLEQLKSSPGITYSQCLKDFDNIEQPTTFRGLHVTCGKEGIDLASHDAKALTDGAVTYIQKRFTIF